jgi:hypothetical protein
MTNVKAAARVARILCNTRYVTRYLLFGEAFRLKYTSLSTNNSAIAAITLSRLHHPGNRLSSFCDQP